ncbi:axin-1-like [Limulus polyphemus]|uniref:Axin-1-like n=1 Tax=Limulus polyphemus TaxID=6850 RepID=A0ABM1SMH8_LIMPO|nr:axin-1-like [Limulus polyphemus]
MTRTTYPSFLKSELYLQYVQLMQQKTHLGSAKQVVDLESVNENNVNFRQGSYILQTLHENAELKARQCHDGALLIREALKQQSRVMKNLSSYPSEAQSGDYSPTLPSRSRVKKHQQMIKKNASLHSDYLGHQAIIPKTQQTPNMFTSLQEEKFAALLTQKLFQVKKERATQERVEESLQKLEAEEDISLSKSCVRNLQHPLDTFLDIPSQFLSEAITDEQAVSEYNDQSILDQHVSRVWNDSAHHTPSGSPSLFSPSSISVSPQLERHRSDSSGFGSLVSLRLSTSGMSTVGLYASPYESVHSHHNNLGHPKGNQNSCSNASGTVHDFTSDNEPRKFSLLPFHLHKHFHHHHSVMAKRVGAASELPSVTSAEHHQTWHSKDVSRKSCCKKLSTNDSSSSCNDSGVSLACDPVLPTLASNQRVSSWMMDNEKYCCGPDLEKDSSTRQKKSNRYSLSTSSPVPGQQRNSKKLVASPSGSSEGEDSILWSLLLQLPGSVPCYKSCSYTPTHTYPWVLQPTQPIALDPSMPVLPPPDTATQLLEAKRRLEDEAHLKCGKNKLNKKILSNHHPGSGYSGEFTIIGYYFSGESVPYRTKLPGKNVTLKQFKTLLSRKGNYRYSIQWRTSSRKDAMNLKLE